RRGTSDIDVSGYAFAIRGVSMRTPLAVAILVGALGVACSDDGGGNATSPTDVPTDADLMRRGDLALVTLNLLHGDACEPATNRCQLDDRFALFGRQVEAAGCPDVVALQEVNQQIYDRVVVVQPTLCQGAYELVWHDEVSHDTELVLTTLPVRDQELVDLAGSERTAYRINLEVGLGEVFLIVTHIGASHQSDGTGGTICRVETQCPLDLCPSGTLMVTCQVLQVHELADEADEGAITLIVGDYNLRPDTPQIADLLAAGFTDAYLEAGNPECDPESGVGCTSGRVDSDLSDLTNPASIGSERIDLILVRAPSDCDPVFDGAADGDGDGLGTGLFADQPAVDGPGGIVFPSDHTGVAMDLSCE
ncbi:MAG: endonuclease/exonuclease/phosphatase family protein, partial [Acidimicrobiia bacterium]